MSRLALRDDGRCASVRHGGVELARYVYRPDLPRLEAPQPYLHPLRTPSGTVVTRHRPPDHPWHKGLSWSLPQVGPYTFWGGPTYERERGYVQRDNVGAMRHDRFVEARVDAAGVTLVEDLAWSSQPSPGGAGEQLVRERRRLAMAVLGPAEEAWALLFDSTMVNVSPGDLPLGSPATRGREGAGYGGLFWRGPRSFAGAAIVAPARSGGDELNGVRAPWVAMSAGGAGVVLVDLPGNPGGGPRWFARSAEYPGLCAAPFFDCEVPFGAGEALEYGYAVVVADGPVDAVRGARLAAAVTELARL